MKLFLMRHGDAEKLMTAYGDRRLTPAGEREADAGGFFLRISGEKPCIIMHSSRVRSIMTAERVMAAVGSGVLAPRTDLGEDSSPEEFLASVTGEFAGTDNRVLAVGHNPFISRLGSMMLAGNKSVSSYVEFKTGALLGADCVDYGKRWSLRFFAAPKMLARIYKAFSKPD